MIIDMILIAAFITAVGALTELMLQRGFSLLNDRKAKRL